MTGVTKTPAGNHLFMTNPDCDKPPEKAVQVFHHIVAKLLYLCKRTRHDIQMAMAFLCTRVKSPDSDDYKKLTHVIQYLRGKQDITLTIKPGDHLNWWVDSSYAVHPDMRSHSGIRMMLGKGAMYSSSCKQKAKYEEFYRGRASRYRRHNGSSVMDMTFSSSAGGNTYQQQPYIKITKALYY